MPFQWYVQALPVGVPIMAHCCWLGTFGWRASPCRCSFANLSWHLVALLLSLQCGDALCCVLRRHTCCAKHTQREGSRLAAATLQLRFMCVHSERPLLLVNSGFKLKEFAPLQSAPYAPIATQNGQILPYVQPSM